MRKGSFKKTKLHNQIKTGNISVFENNQDFDSEYRHISIDRYFNGISGVYYNQYENQKDNNGNPVALTGFAGTSFRFKFTWNK